MSNPPKPLTQIRRGRAAGVPLVPAEPPPDDEEMERLDHAVRRIQKAVSEADKGELALYHALRKGLIPTTAWAETHFVDASHLWPSAPEVTRNRFKRGYDSVSAGWGQSKDRWLFLGKPQVDSLVEGLQASRTDTKTNDPMLGNAASFAGQEEQALPAELEALLKASDRRARPTRAIWLAAWSLWRGPRPDQPAAVRNHEVFLRMSSTPFNARNIKGGAKAVISQWARMGLKDEAEALAVAAADPASNPAELARAIVSRADEIASHLRTGNRTNTRQTFAEAAQAALTASIEAKHRKGLTGVTTGLIDLDRATGGLQRRDLILIGARPSMGKTTIGTSIARHAAESGVGIGFFSLEMDSVKLGSRMVSDLAHANNRRVPYQDIIAGHTTSDQDDAIAQAIEQRVSLPILIDDASGLTIAEIRAKTETMIEDAQDRGCPLGLLIIDHLGKVKPSARYAGNRNNEVGEITDGLKSLAREYDLAVVLLSQLSRQVESRDDKRPVLSDLRDSGNIEQDADAVMFLHRQAYYLERAEPADFDKRIEWQTELDACRNRGELAIAKQRNGACLTVDLHIDIACSAVRNAARSF